MRLPTHWLRLILCFSVSVSVLTLPSAAALAAPPRLTTPTPPKLILLLVVDQLRADQLQKFESRLGEGGIRALLKTGAYYPTAEYDMLQSLTGPGHATILSGAYPYQGGVPANYWFEKDRGGRVYCAQDESHSTVGAPTHKRTLGMSPRNFLGTTVGDELKNAGYPSRVVSLALKDRAAILMGGHRADLAVWLDQQTFRWVSSTFYLPEKKLPAWVEKENLRLAQLEKQTHVWEVSGPGSGLAASDPMIRQDEWNQRLGPAFPHRIHGGNPKSLSMPYGIEVTADLAIAALGEYKLGRGKATDVLAVSFSAHDYLLHAFGPNSREAEEMLLVDDRAIARILKAVGEQVPGGLKNVTVVLTGDHGGPPNPDWLKANKVPAGRLDEQDILRQFEARLVALLGKPPAGEPWVHSEEDLGYYLNRPAIAATGKPLEQVHAELKALVEKIPGVAHGITDSDVAARRIPPGQIERQVLKTWFKGRSPDVFVLPRPFFMAGGDTVIHMTGYTYDRMVPLIIAGAGIRPGLRAEKAEVIDIAPTLSFLTGTVPPALSEGRVLKESLKP